MTETPDPRTRLILGFLIGGAILVGVSMFASGTRGSEDVTVPARDIITRDTAVANPVRLVFRTDPPLALTPMGWMAGDMHLHVLVDSVPLMAGAQDIEALPGGGFAWTLPPIAPGTHNIRLFWSDERHAPLGDTTTASLTVLQTP